MVDRQTLEIFDANPMAETVYGYTRDELIGRYCTDICVMGEDHRKAAPDRTDFFSANAVTAGGFSIIKKKKNRSM